MGSKPDAVGDLPAFTITFSPGANDPGAVAGDVHVFVRKPDGTEAEDTGAVAQTAANVWAYTATARIDQAGPWRWRWNSNSGLIDSGETGLTIGQSSFAHPLGV